jgi:chromosomal replication initiation ATPase DnaA
MRRVQNDTWKLKLIMELVGMTTGTPMTAICGDKRGIAPTARARQVAMYLAHVGFGYSLAHVGGMFSRDKSTVGHAVHQIEDLRDNAEFDAWLSDLELVLVLASKLFTQTGQVLSGVWRDQLIAEPGIHVSAV